MTEQWTGDWMRDKDTGRLVDEPVLNRYEMFMLIRELRVTIRNHAQSIRDRDAVIEAAEKRRAELEMALTTIADHRTQLSWAACSRIAREALAATEPKPEQAG